MDALSEAMRTARLSGALIVDTQLPGQWCYQSPRPESLREDFLPGERLLAFHLVVEGTCVAFRGSRLSRRARVNSCCSRRVNSTSWRVR